MKGKILKYAGSSKLMNLTIKYGHDKFSFNLFEELVIDENTINRELQEQPNSYAFLSLLHKKLKRFAKDKEAELNKIFAKNFIVAKENPDNGRASDELCKSYAIDDDEYSEAMQVYLKAQEDCDLIEVCVKSFEQRANLIQSISANLRKEK